MEQIAPLFAAIVGVGVVVTVVSAVVSVPYLDMPAGFTRQLEMVFLLMVVIVGLVVTISLRGN